MPIGIGADNVEVMSYGDMARQFCALEVDMAKGNFYELKGCITPNKEPQGLRFAIHDVEAWGWDNIRWAMNRAGSATTACCGHPSGPCRCPDPGDPLLCLPCR